MNSEEEVSLELARLNGRLTREVRDLRAINAELVAACEAAHRAMLRSIEEGTTDHLDCCNDHGAYWYRARDLLSAALAKART